MLLAKTVKFPFPFNRTDFFIVDQVIRDTEAEYICRSDLFIADEKAPDGMTRIKAGEPYWHRRAGQNIFPPVRFYGDQPANPNPVENPRSPSLDFRKADRQ